MAEKLETPVKYTPNIWKGYIFPPYLTEEWLEQASSVFKPRDTDIFIASPPRSGIHWLTLIVYMLKKQEKLPKPYIGGLALYLEIPHVDKLVIETLKGELNLPDGGELRLTKAIVEAYPDPRFFFTHFPYEFLPKNPATKYIYIYRNPKDIVVSMHNHFQDERMHTIIGTFDEFFKLYIENDCFNYCKHVKYYIEHKDDPNFFVLSYEELNKNFKTKVYEIATFLGIQLSKEFYELLVQETNFETVHESEYIDDHKIVTKESYCLLPKCKVGAWKSTLSQKYSEKIDEILLTKLGEDFIQKYISFS
ncbi:Amine sulfotransferase [Oopsacas minuta]|uniref:Amine sulfotransferase n=1 Tax=Oopsacas minuta TaxID=111878 RepID=A0AAV7K7N6_9METZ|nr:Amine sulfotransferase [Oopsacas minuta]